MYYILNFNRLFTVISLISSVCCLIESFPKLEDITISKEKHQDNYSCFVKKSQQIKAVVCTYCEVIEDASGYRVTTRRIQLMQLHFLHDGRVMKVPLRLNCHRKEQSPSTKVTQVISSRKSIAITLDNKAGVIVLYMDGKSSFSAIKMKPVREYEIKALREDTLYQICISVFNTVGESGNYSCVQTKTKKLTNKVSAVANKNGDPCKTSHTVQSIEADITAHNLVKVKWKIKLQGYCEISHLEIKMFEKNSKKCLVLLILHKRMKTYKTVETDNCGNRKSVRVKSLTSGEVLRFWPHLSVHVQGIIVTSHGKLKMKDGDYSSTNLIDNLANKEETIKTTCFSDCLITNAKYSGIRSINKRGRSCTKWSESEKYSTIKRQNNLCYKPDKEKKAWCADNSNDDGRIHCDIPACVDNEYDCVSSVTASSTSVSISGKFTVQKNLKYLMLLYVLPSVKCIKSILQGLPVNNEFTKISDFIGACTDEESLTYPNIDGNFNFTDLNHGTEYRVYIVNFGDRKTIGKIAHYTHKTKIIKPGRAWSVTVNTVNSSSIKISWKAPWKSYVENYQIDVVNNKMNTMHQTKEKSIILKKLKECTKYCVTVRAINNVGSSPVSKTVCNITFAKGRGNITFENIQSNSQLSKTISWSHSTEKCVDSYIIIYWPKNKSLGHREENYTNKKSFHLDQLLPYTQYEIQLHARLSRTDNGNVNVSSNIQTFQTGYTEGTKNNLFITFLCVLVAFLSYLDQFSFLCGW